MLLGDILIARGLVTPEDIVKATEHQNEHGGRVGESLVAIGALTAEKLEEVLHGSPASPKNLEEMGVSSTLLLQLLIKTTFANNLETPGQMAEATKMPFNVVKSLLDMADDRKLLDALGAAAGSASLTEFRYALTEAGRRYAADAMSQSQYVGPAPVSLETFQNQVLAQRITNERIDKEGIAKSFADITVPEDFVRRLGPGINAGKCILLYGPPGNGKTTIAEKIGAIFENVIYIPYCFEVDGQIIKVFDPAIHKEVESSGVEQKTRRIRREEFDSRWVACHRPVVITGGELTLEMLDLSFNPVAKYYEAPLHIKALGGTFIIDDFGRQLAAPEDILNRWIVPLQSRVDYMKLHTGNTFVIPFDELVIFSTNLSPMDLMDGAFLRRIPYKLETEEPSKEDFTKVFGNVAKAHGLELTDEILDLVLENLQVKNKQTLAYYQPIFIIEQVISACKYEGIQPIFDKEMVEMALQNLFAKKPKSDMGHTAAKSAVKSG